MVDAVLAQAGAYAAVLHYLKAVTAALNGDTSGNKVVAKMKELPTGDRLFGKGTIRVDGRKMHPIYLLEVKAPGQAEGPWDYFKVTYTIAAGEGLPSAQGRRLPPGAVTGGPPSPASRAPVRSLSSINRGTLAFCLSGW